VLYDLAMPRRLLARTIALVLALLLGVLAAPAFCPRLDLAAAAAAAGAAEARLPAPIFVYPQVDDERGSGVLALFCRADDAGAEWTVVFGDEDHPWLFIDRAYKLFRWRRWRRIMDVETFRYGGAPAPAAILFPDTFAGEQRWDVFLARHLGAAVPIGAFALEDGRPVIHINTWNHMFGERTTNADRPLARASSAPVFGGSREEVEALFAAFYARVWWRPWAALAVCALAGALVPIPSAAAARGPARPRLLGRGFALRREAARDASPAPRGPDSSS
jgi:hypothetical protein